MVPSPYGIWARLVVPPDSYRLLAPTGSPVIPHTASFGPKVTGLSANSVPATAAVRLVEAIAPAPLVAKPNTVLSNTAPLPPASPWTINVPPVATKFLIDVTAPAASAGPSEATSC